MKDCRPLFRDEEDVYVFREFLERLRQHGSDLLVTGEVPQRVTNRASRTLFGDNIHDRKRVLALTDAGISTADEHFPADFHPTTPPFGSSTAETAAVPFRRRPPVSAKPSRRWTERTAFTNSVRR